MNIQPCVFIVDDDEAVRDGLGLVIESAGLAFQTFAGAEIFLENFCPGTPGCLVLDINMPGMSGHELQAELKRRKMDLPIIFLTAYGDIPMTVRAIKAGAIDFLTKPVRREVLLERIETVFQQIANMQEQAVAAQVFRNSQIDLTPREMEVLPLALAGVSNKDIAQILGISYRTIEVHRIRILQKTGAANFLELAHLYERFILPKLTPYSLSDK